VSKYAGGALPEPARATVRTFILHLPQRWASASQDVEADPPAPRSSKARRPRGSRNNSRHHVQQVTHSSSSPVKTPESPSAADQAARKILTLATESLDMLSSVTAVFKESLERADTWVERLRMIGIQRQQSHETEDPGSSPTPEDNLPMSIHQRLGSSSTLSSQFATTSAYISSPPPDTPSVASPDLVHRPLADDLDDFTDSDDSEDEARPRKSAKLG